MTRIVPASRRDARVLLLGLLGGLALTGCSWFGGKAKPAWVDGGSAEFSSSQYLLGEGQSASKSAASDQAYAAVARIFKAEVASQAKDWESYLLVETRGASNAERRLTLDTITKVSTDKVLENVTVLDAWYDASKGLHYVLAGMHRGQGETALLEKMRELDRAIESDLTDARQTADKLTKVRALRRATRSLVMREAYNADLRVIRPSGQGSPSAYTVNDLTNELDQFLSANLLLAVEVAGDHAEPIQRSLTEGLIREGLHVTHRAVNGDGAAPELLVRGTVRIWPIEVGDPKFKYVRWCSDFEVVESVSQRVLGALSRGGKEGHLSDREATAKALRVIQQEFSSDLAKAIASHVFGEAPLPASTAPPAGCPRDPLPVTPGPATPPSY
ncbi:MAG TPA: LPP20 family lipoprotein [Nitrospira sp.]|nr:LPP20 family lipoprotein [Nitrospira sp.]